jgi:23S rRNA (cytosine1962-C5)-methyltransferase
VFGRFSRGRTKNAAAPQLLSGDSSLQLVTTVMEEGVRYQLDFSAGYSVGLFLDQRANRRFLRTVGSKRVLNTFAYTCSFSVVGALAWCRVRKRRSLAQVARPGTRELQAQRPRRHEASLPRRRRSRCPSRLGRRGETFDAIILDPPTFSRGNRGRRFQVEHDLEALLSAALEVAAPTRGSCSRRIARGSPRATWSNSPATR